MYDSNCNNSKQIMEGDIKHHNAPIKNSLWSYKLFQWGNFVMKHCGFFSR